VKAPAQTGKTSSRIVGGVSALAIVLVGTVGAYEGLRLKAYKDPVGIPTICFGETKGVQMGQVKTKAECDAMLVDSLVEHELGMVKCINDPAKLPDLTYGAFVSFTYNVGVGAFCKSTMLKKINAGDLVGACNELLKWTKAKGKELPGLVKRRQGEREMCLKGLK
jgi:lysozyme